MSRVVLYALLLAILASPGVALAQPVRDDGAERERAFIEGLRSEDPASAERFIALRDAQRQAMAELRRKEGQTNAMPPDLRASLLPQLKQPFYRLSSPKLTSPPQGTPQDAAYPSPTYELRLKPCCFPRTRNTAHPPILPIYSEYHSPRCRSSTSSLRP